MKPIEMREADFKRDVWAFNYPESLKIEFFDYWTEPNKSNTKMKFEMEKTWHLGRRIARWANNGFNSIKNNNKAFIPVKKEAVKTPENDFDKLDQFLLKYSSRPADMEFKEFGKWYDFMKAEKLLMPLTAQKIEELKTVYEGDNYKCRCACVQLTLDGYVKSNWTVSMIIEARNRVA